MDIDIYHIYIHPGPATGSHIVSRGTPVGHPQLNVPKKQSHPHRRPVTQSHGLSPHFLDQPPWKRRQCPKD